jgi:PAS domain S-box-containing protein
MRSANRHLRTPRDAGFGDKKEMKKHPSFRRFLFTAVFILQALSLAVVISYLHAIVHQSMEKEYFNHINVQRAELHMYLSNRLSHLHHRIAEISNNNNIRVSLLLGMAPKVASIIEKLYPPENGAAFYISYHTGEIFPKPGPEHSFLTNLGPWLSQQEQNRMIGTRPDTLVFRAPIHSIEKFQGHAVCVYSLTDDLKAYQLIKAFGTLQLVEKRADNFINIYADQKWPLSDQIAEDKTSRNTMEKANFERNTDLIRLQIFPSLFLHASDKPLQIKHRNLIVRLIALCLPIFILTITVSCLIIHRMTASLNALAQNAQYIADSETRSDLDEKRVKHIEFIHFTRAFNKVLSKVRSQTVALTRANKNLQTEIQKRTRIAEVLHERETQLRSLQSNIPIGLCRLTLDGKLISVNPKFLSIFNYAKKQEMLELSFDSIFDRPDDFQTIKKRIEREEVIQALETRFRRKDDNVIWCALHLKKLHDQASGNTFLDGAILDITDRKKVEAEKQNLEIQLRQSQKMEAIGTLAGGIAHDFNNILAAIDGFSELALDDVPKGSLLYDNIEEIRVATRRATDLVKQILTFARQTEVEKRPVKFAVILEENLKLLRPTIPSNIDIRKEIHTQKLVTADPTQLHQIIFNLCSNAAHAMRTDNGLLSIYLRDLFIDMEKPEKLANLMPGPYFDLCIRDTGHGMTREVMERIFDPYFTTKNQGDGTGMGLSVVQGIINSMRGAVTVESAPDKGTTVHVYLPVLEKQDQPKEKYHDPLTGGTEHILLVDDETALTHMGRQMLERLGYQVTVRNSSVEALALFRTAPERFDLVISDMAMPQMTGDTLAREIMRIRPDIPIILCTGYSDQISQEQAKDKGIHGLLYKPILKHELAASIRSVLDKKPDLFN